VSIEAAMTHPMQQEKAEIRARALARRDGLDATARAAAAAALEARAPALGDVAGRVVSGFWPIRSEIDPRPLMRRLALDGAAIALPVTIDQKTLVFRRWNGDAGALRRARFGLMEPGPEAEELDPDTMLVPLAAFDRRLNRIGYGAGYYDRYIAGRIAKGKTPRLIGVAFSCQEVEAVPAEVHDQPLDMMLTETGVLRPTMRETSS